MSLLAGKGEREKKKRQGDLLVNFYIFIYISQKSEILCGGGDFSLCM